MSPIIMTNNSHTDLWIPGMGLWRAQEQREISPEAAHQVVHNAHPQFTPYRTCISLQQLPDNECTYTPRTEVIA